MQLLKRLCHYVRIKEGIIMNELKRENIPYFLTKEYGDRQKKKHKNLFIICVVFCVGIFVVKSIWF